MSIHRKKDGDEYPKVVAEPEDGVQAILMPSHLMPQFKKWLEQGGTLQLSPPMLFSEDDIPNRIIGPTEQALEQVMQENGIDLP